MYNLLTEPLIRYDNLEGKITSANLPEVYTALMADQVNAFSALRPHQRHAWHTFLVQLGVMAICQAGIDTPPESADKWAKLIRGLTIDYPDDEPWQMVVDDITKPAFMQPPASSKGREVDYKQKQVIATPDAIDILVNSRQHGQSFSIAVKSEIDDWIFAIISLQTMNGYSGIGKYGISRMNSGYGNRSAFSFAPSNEWGEHIKHDLITLLEKRELILNEYPMINNGIKLLWTEPWDGKKTESLLIDKLDPFYIEICRRIRLTCQNDNLFDKNATSKDKRIIDKTGGLVGDPWTPVRYKTNSEGTPKSFLGPLKFSYKRIVDGLFSTDWKTPILLDNYPSNSNIQLIARGTIRGQGGTEGYHERIIPIKPKTIKAFGENNTKEELGDIAKERIKQISIVQKHLRYSLSNSISSFTCRGKINFWVNKFDDIIDYNFFEDLQNEFEDIAENRENNRKQWLKNSIVNQAEKILQTAIDSMPIASIQKYKVSYQTKKMFDSGLRGTKGLPFLFE